MIIRTRLILLALAPLLGGCPGHIPTTSISGSECKVFEGPEYEVLGRSKYDQHWIDSTVEGGVGACHWPRPAPRPAELDASPVPKSAPAVKPRPAKSGLIKRSRARLWPKTSVAPIVAPPAPVADDAPPPDPPLPSPDPPAPKPRRPLTAIEELLHLRPSDNE